MPLPSAALRLTPALTTARSSHGRHSRGGHRGAQKRVPPPTTEQRVEWAQTRLESAVQKLAHATEQHEPTSLYIASILGRFAELQDMRALLRRERADSRRRA